MRAKPAAREAPASAEQMATLIQNTMAATEALVLRSGGDILIELGGEDAGLDVSLAKHDLLLHAWCPQRSLVRRVMEVKASGRGLRLSCRRLGCAQPEVLYLESVGGSGETGMRSSRQLFRRALLAQLERQYPGWKVVPCGYSQQRAEENGCHLVLFRHARHWMAWLAIAPEESLEAAETALTRLLDWTAQPLAEDCPDVVPMHLLVPGGVVPEFRERIRWMRRPELFHLHAWTDSGIEELPSSVEGNIWTRLRHATTSDAGHFADPFTLELLRDVQRVCPEARLRAGARGLSIHVLGLEIASEQAVQLPGQAPATRFSFGLGRQTPLTHENRGQFLELAASVQRQRHGFGHMGQELFRCRPEAWLEELVRRDLRQLEPDCLEGFAYTQVPARRATWESVLDVLGILRDGRLAIFELKAAEDLNFPLQALDYWSAVRHHLRNGDFQRLGYFPGVELAGADPVLYLVSPALRWHPRTGHILRWISDDVPLRRISINEDWRAGIKVLERR